MKALNSLVPTEKLVKFRDLLVGDVIVTRTGEPDEVRELVTGVGATGVSVSDQHGRQRSLSLSHETELLVRDTERTDARANLEIQRESMSDADPIRPAQSPWFVVMNSTCSGAGPAIVENCMDPKTGETWERQLADLPTTHIEREDMHAVGPVGTFNTHPERFELHRDSEFEPEEVFAIASTMAAAPVMLDAIDAVLRSFAYAPGAGPEWFEACRAAHALATTPYVPTPDINRA